VSEPRDSRDEIAPKLRCADNDDDNNGNGNDNEWQDYVRKVKSADARMLVISSWVTQ